MKRYRDSNRKEYNAMALNTAIRKCQEQNERIIMQIIKITYIYSPENLDHWINNIAGMIYNNSPKIKSGIDFNYGWFFSDVGPLDEQSAYLYYVKVRNMKSRGMFKYLKVLPSIMPSPQLLIDNVERVLAAINSDYYLNSKSNKNYRIPKDRLKEILSDNIYLF